MYTSKDSPAPFDLLYWKLDSTRMPEANHSFYLRGCYLENKLSKGEMRVGGERLDLGKITIPIYNLATREDHIAPAISVFKGCSFFGGPVDYVLAGSGHIAGVVNPPAKVKYQYWTGGKAEGSLDDWMKSATETPGPGGRTGSHMDRGPGPGAAETAENGEQDAQADRGRAGELCEDQGLRGVLLPGLSLGGRREGTLGIMQETFSFMALARLGDTLDERALRLPSRERDRGRGSLSRRR